MAFARQRLSQVRHPRGTAPQHPPCLRSTASSFPATVGEQQGHGCPGEARREPRLQQGRLGTHLSGLRRREGERPRGPGARPARTPAAAGHPRTAWGRPASRESSDRHQPNLGAQQGKGVARSSPNPGPPVGGALRDQWRAESPRATAPQAR